MAESALATLKLAATHFFFSNPRNNSTQLEFMAESVAKHFEATREHPLAFKQALALPSSHSPFSPFSSSSSWPRAKRKRKGEGEEEKGRNHLFKPARERKKKGEEEKITLQAGITAFPPPTILNLAYSHPTAAGQALRQPGPSPLQA